MTITTFTFYETSCAAPLFAFPGRCLDQTGLPLYSLPAPVVTMTISDPSGSAVFSGFGTASVSDPAFSLNTETGQEPGTIHITPSNYSSDIGFPYNVTWTADGDNLISVSVFARGTNTTLALGLDGGNIGSDGLIGTCAAGTCAVTGFWSAADGVRVPEPGTYLLLAALLGLLVLSRRILALGPINRIPKQRIF